MDISSVGNLMNRIGYQLTSCVDETIVEEFEDPFHLMEYLSGLGLSQVGANSRKTVLKDVMMGVLGVYDFIYSTIEEKEGK